MYSPQAIYLALRKRIFNSLDAAAVTNLSGEELRNQLRQAVDVLVEKDNLPVPAMLRMDFVNRFVDEIKGLGPLQTLIDDHDISDIMVNGPDCVFIEKKGLLRKSDVRFIDEEQLLGIAKRIAASVGRRVDESQPMCDARLLDGSRVNIAIPPVAIDGTSISIRKFNKVELGLDDLRGFGAMSREMADLLKIASRCRLNILVSGGTGSGKTTLLNALSQHISETERVLTIEDAAELRLQQPHVVRMETRHAGIENTGAIHQRDLVINSLRMRPDRIIVGECRGGEAFEMLQAMNTGHDGSMSTLHANTPRDALGRLESMVMMAAPNLPLDAIRRNIASAVDLIVQVSRLFDGSRKVMSITEIMGIEGNNVVLEEIFRFEPTKVLGGERIEGEFITPGLISRSSLQKKARMFGLEDQLKSVFQGVS
ncbi:CpaF family protein [Sansalvadorimonas sp. 2012CJ34-2]|uniref:CpaF family protein n=1 Tax=Parendozoicomonas callyspongiae TaxID=2942213 RepID=A0ABT0PJ88_9GAMM|nr:CpaF family protein [Sansalvadorimonas sp. 2012CJ34-2]MCL6271459.1 CpaF family protein [Sansalvadorimonas sp. 2012CJ34-2]